MYNITMILSVVGVLTIPLLIGFALGYMVLGRWFHVAVVRPHVSAA
jgi:hypothetical protein